MRWRYSTICTVLKIYIKLLFKVREENSTTGLNLRNKVKDENSTTDNNSSKVVNVWNKLQTKCVTATRSDIYLLKARYV